jgi:hypothetical protein
MQTQIPVGNRHLLDLRSRPCRHPARRHDEAGRETALMQVRRTRGIRPLPPRTLCLAVVVSVGVLALAGCSSGSGPKGPVITQACGTSRTAANVPVEVEINHGQVSCAVALTVEKSYAAAIVAGQAPGNGGGGPVTVNGWKCQGFPTPELLKTGDVSKCGKDGVEIVAILKSPS